MGLSWSLKHSRGLRELEESGKVPAHVRPLCRRFFNRSLLQTRHANPSTQLRSLKIFPSIMLSASTSQLKHRIRQAVKRPHFGGRWACSWPRLTCHPGFGGMMTPKNSHGICTSGEWKRAQTALTAFSGTRSDTSEEVGDLLDLCHR